MSVVDADKRRSCITERSVPPVRGAACRCGSCQLCDAIEIVCSVNGRRAARAGTGQEASLTRAEESIAVEHFRLQKCFTAIYCSLSWLPLLPLTGWPARCPGAPARREPGWAAA